MRTLAKKAAQCRRAARVGVRDDSGIAMITVVATSAIMFLMATTLLGIVAFQASQVSHEVRRNKAMHVADAGINAYLYELRRNPDFYKTTATLDGALDNGDTWTVAATDTAGTMPLTLHSTGTLTSTGTTRTVIATVRYPSLAEPKYTLLGHGTVAVYPGTRIHGNVIVQKPSPSTAAILNLGGQITGFARCYGNSPGPSGRITIYGSGRADEGLQPFYSEATDPQVDVASQFSVTRAVLEARARAAGTYFPRPGQPTPGKGYWIELKGSTATVWAVGGTIVTGTQGDPPGANFPGKWVIGTYDLASHPVFYFFSDVFVSGTYSSSLTICGVGERIWMYHNILPSPVNGPATLGLVSDRDVGVP